MNAHQENLFPSATPDLSDPLGLLRACHQRILNHCDTLQRLAEHLKADGADAEAKQAAAQVHRYFSSAGRHHHEDEEQDLFPRLARQSLKLADLVHSLRQDHEKLDAWWSELEPMLLRLAAIGDHDAFATLVRNFTDGQREHVARENEELLEIAQHLLSSDELKSLSNAMAERRGMAPKYY